MANIYYARRLPLIKLPVRPDQAGLQLDRLNNASLALENAASLYAPYGVETDADGLAVARQAPSTR